MQPVQDIDDDAILFMSYHIFFMIVVSQGYIRFFLKIVLNVFDHNGGNVLYDNNEFLTIE